jgi:hypothetical protein
VRLGTATLHKHTVKITTNTATTQNCEVNDQHIFAKMTTVKIRGTFTLAGVTNFSRSAFEPTPTCAQIQHANSPGKSTPLWYRHLQYLDMASTAQYLQEGRHCNSTIVSTSSVRNSPGCYGSAAVRAEVSVGVHRTQSWREERRPYKARV